MGQNPNLLDGRVDRHTVLTQYWHTGQSIHSPLPKDHAMPQIIRRLAPAFALMVIVSSLTAAAQTKSKTSASKSKTETKEEKAAEKKVSSKYHRLPTYYGQLELDEEQIAEIYSIRDSFGPKIDALMKEIEELKDQQDEKIKDVLTRTQVTALNKLKAGGKSSANSDSPKKSTTKSSSKSTKTTSSKD